MIAWTNGCFSDGTNRYSSISQLPDSNLSSTAQDVISKLTTKRTMSYAKESDFEVPTNEGLTFKPYQLAGIEYLVKYKKALLADDQGLGKTIQVAGLLNVVTPKKVLIVSPASLKINWKKEITKWCTYEPTISILEGRKAKVTDSSITIVNYDVCHYILKELLNVEWDAIIIDEAHYLKNLDTKRTKAIWKVCEGVERVVLMSGTPMSNRPKELYSIFKGVFLNYLPVHLQNQIGFWKYFCEGFQETIRVKGQLKRVWNKDGASNLEELNGILRERVMIRRLKKDVLPQLPDRIVSIIDLNTTSKVRRLVKSISESKELEIIEAISKGERMPPLEEMVSVRKELALEKVPLVVSHIEDLLESEQKVILFAHHKEVVEKLRDSLSDYGVSVLTGTTSLTNRDKAVVDFQEGFNRIFIGNIQAAGVGLTLTAASHVVFAEVSWVPSEIEQAIDRAHRIGQKRCVNATFLVFGGTFDSRVLCSALTKQQNIDILVK